MLAELSSTIATAEALPPPRSELKLVMVGLARPKAKSASTAARTSIRNTSWIRRRRRVFCTLIRRKPSDPSPDPRRLAKTPDRGPPSPQGRGLLSQMFSLYPSIFRLSLPKGETLVLRLLRSYAFIYKLYLLAFNL